MRISLIFLRLEAILVLAIVGERQPQPDEDEHTADAAVEPLFESRAWAERGADSRRQPRHQEIPKRAVDVEDQAEKQKCQRIRRLRIDELRKKCQKEQRNLGVQDIGEKALQKNAAQRSEPAIARMVAETALAERMRPMPTYKR